MTRPREEARLRGRSSGYRAEVVSTPEHVAVDEHDRGLKGRARRQTRHAEATPAFRRLARTGIAARALVYLMFGALVMEIALAGHSSAPADTQGAFSLVERLPAGNVLLGALAAGLAAYAAFRVVQSLAGSPDARRNATWTRVGWMGSGLIYLAVFAEALAQIAGGGAGGPSSHPQPFVHHVLTWPGGPELLGAAAIGAAVGGVALGIFGVLHDYGEVLEHPGGTTLRLAHLSGMVGDLARGLVLALVAAYLFLAALTRSARHAKSLAAALQSLVGLPGGREALGVLASGLVLYAASSAIEARYRRI